MTDEIIKSDNAEDGDKVIDTVTDTRIDTEPKETKENKPRTVSFNRDVHIKRFDKPRASRSASSEQQPSVRKEPFTHLSKEELIEEANKVRAQAQGITCTSDHPPEKFFSLPHRRKKDNRIGRRNSDDGSPEKTPLGRSTSDVSNKKRKERTSLSTLFRRAQRNRSPDAAVVVDAKPVIVKRSKSDVSDLKSNTNLTTQSKPVRKRSGSETEEFLKSLRNKKTQLSPIIESSPREDYFKKIPPLDLYQKQKSNLKESKSEEPKPSEIKKVNPVEKPPRHNKYPDKPEPKAPLRSKRGKSLEKEKSPQVSDTLKEKSDTKKILLVDEVDSFKNKDDSPIEIKDRIKDSIRKIEENIYGDKDMIHSSQQPPDKPVLTRGHTVDQLVKILKEDQAAAPPKSHLISPPNGTNINQPFSYIKPSVSPDPNLFVRNPTPDRVPTPVNKTDKGVVYAQIIRDQDLNTTMPNKQTMHKAFSPSRENYGHLSDEDEGLGYEDRYKFSHSRMYDYDYKNNNENDKYNTFDTYTITDSPIRPRFREYKLTNFNEFEPTYANENSPDNKSPDLIDKFRGRGDGMDNKKKQYEPETQKIDLDFNELSHRRQLLESRLHARRQERTIQEPMIRYLPEDPIYEAEKRMQATERYVNETVRYYRNTLERDGYTESSVTEDYNKYDSDNHKIKYSTESRLYKKPSKDEIDSPGFNARKETRYKNNKKDFPPEPEYEPPSLESNIGKPVLTPDEYKEKKYKVKKQLASSQDILQTGQKYKAKDEWFGKRKGHYASNPEIAQEREEEYANLPRYADSYQSLRRIQNKDRYKEDFSIKRHDSGDSREYYREEKSPRRFDIDNRLVDSGIENDFRKDSNGDIHRSRHRRHESDDNVRDTSLFLQSERRHTEDNYPNEQMYANGDRLASFQEYRDEGYTKEYRGDRSADDTSHIEPRLHRYDKSPKLDDKVSAKPPKAKKLSGLEKMKQLFSRDSSKKSKKEKEPVQQKPRTRVLKSPEHLARNDSDYKRFTDPEPSEITVKKINYECKSDERRFRSSREDLDRYESTPRDIEQERKYRDSEYDGRYDKTLKQERRYQEHKEEKRRYTTPDRESDRQSRPSDGESELRKSRSRPTELDNLRKSRSRPLDSPALAERYRERRRLATPSPTPSPLRHQPPPTPTSTNTSVNWFKSLDRLTARKKGKSIKDTKIEKESTLTTEDESPRTVTTEDELPRKPYTKSSKTLNSPAKNLRFFGETDQESDGNAKTSTEKRYSKRSTLRKTTSNNSSTGFDETDHNEMSHKSYSLTNLHRDGKSISPHTKQYKRNLQNISETLTNSENDSQLNRKVNSKPPISPYERSRSHSRSKTLRGSKGDLRRRPEDRGSFTELRGSKQELNGTLKHRRGTPVTTSGESSTDSSQQSQRSVVYLHATTVGDIPDPDCLTRNRSRDDVSSIMSSNLQVRNTTKSFSIFAPWTPKHYNDQHDVHYAQRQRKSKSKEVVKKASSTKTLTDDRPPALQKKSYSQTTLTRRPQNNRLTSSSQTLYKKPEKRSVAREENGNSTMRKSTRDSKKSQSSEIINRDSDRDKISRSISMPKDNNKKAAWFKLSSKNKKPEINSRVR